MTVIAERSRTLARCGFFAFVAACAFAIACSGDTPADPNPKPASRPAQPLIVSIRVPDDSTVIYELTATDTLPFVSLIFGIETYGAPHGPWPYNGWEIVAETTMVSPARYVAHVVDTMHTSTGWHQWIAIGMHEMGGEYPRHEGEFGRIYVGTQELRVVVSGMPVSPIQQVGMDLVISKTGPNPARSIVAFVDSGTAGEKAYGLTTLDSEQIKTDGNPNRGFHLWLTGPFTNGTHTLTVALRDSTGRTASSKTDFIVALPSKQYRMRPILVADAIDAYPKAINNDGVIVGSYRLADSVLHPFRWTAGALELLAPGRLSEATAINDSGIVAGYIRGAKDSVVLWRASNQTPIAELPWVGSVGPMNNRGEILINHYSVLRTDGSTRPGPFYWLSDINNLGAITGYTMYPENGSTGAARLADPNVTSINPPYSPTYTGWDRSPHCCFSNGSFVNDAGQVIGSAQNSPVSFLWQKGQNAYWLINPLGTGRAWAMSKGNLVLGELSNGSLAVWEIGGPTSIISMDAQGWVIDSFVAINNRGQIIAHGKNQLTGQKSALLLDPI